jgi:hypothetical protein
MKRCGFETLVNGSMEKENNYLGNTVPYAAVRYVLCTVLPDPEPPGCGFISQRYEYPDPSLSSKNSKKPLDFYCFMTFYDFLSVLKCHGSGALVYVSVTIIQR